jgi:regulator of cell morphogenesis and NO signaling
LRQNKDSLDPPQYRRRTTSHEVFMQTISARSTVADIAASAPATIRVFQQHDIEFCCGGKIPLAEACARQGLDLETLVAELRAAQQDVEPSIDPSHMPLRDLVAHIQQRFHEPLRGELPRLSAMLTKVVDRHGLRLSDTLLPLQATFDRLQAELLDHMAKEDAVLFPAIIALESQEGDRSAWDWLAQPIHVMEVEHQAAGGALAAMRTLSGSYTPPEWACATFVGLYHGLAQLERDMHEHVHLENNVLFPRAAGLVGELCRLRAVE